MKQVLIAAIFITCMVSPAYCHRLDIAYSLDGNELVIEAWMGRDEPTAGAEVTLLSEDGEVIHQDKMDEQGIYRAALPQQSPFNIRVFAGRGHQNELQVTQDDLTALRASSQEASLENGDAAHVHSAANSTYAGSTAQNQLGQPVKIIIGFIFITSLMAAWFAYRADQRLRAIEKRLDHFES